MKPKQALKYKVVTMACADCRNDVEDTYSSNYPDEKIKTLESFCWRCGGVLSLVSIKPERKDMKPKQIINRTYKAKRLDKRLTIAGWCFAIMLLTAWVFFGCEDKPNDAITIRSKDNCLAVERGLGVGDTFYNTAVEYDKKVLFKGPVYFDGPVEFNSTVNLKDGERLYCRTEPFDGK